MTIKIVNVSEMVAIEHSADKLGHSFVTMMQFAGRALADHILQTLLDQFLEPQILFLIGPGNNGGDGLVAAKCLCEDLDAPEIAAYLLKARSDQLVKEAEVAGVKIFLMEHDQGLEQLVACVEGAGVIVDGLFGTGTRLPITGNAAKLLKQVHMTLHERAAIRPLLNPVSHPMFMTDRPIVIAIDCPSGLNCDTGELDPLTLKADSTVTFAAAKIGQFRFPGAAAVGQLVIGDIGLPEGLAELNQIKLELADGILIRDILPERPLDGHKGRFGKTMIVGGSANYIGAAYLGGSAAYRVGTGLVTIAAPHSIIPTLASMLPEATWLSMPYEFNLEGYSALLVGPGLGQSETVHQFIEALLASQTLPPLVIDADGLNILAKIEAWWEHLPAKTILTPHPTEFARLAKTANPTQEERISLAIKYAEKWDCVVVLKGAFTIVANPNGTATLIPFATSALSTAGTGDVLAGLIVGLLAQGIEPVKAAIAGAWLHGFAGKQAEYAHGNAASVLASDVLAQVPIALSLILSGKI